MASFEPATIIKKLFCGRKNIGEVFACPHAPYVTPMQRTITERPVTDVRALDIIVFSNCIRIKELFERRCQEKKIRMLFVSV